MSVQYRNNLRKEQIFLIQQSQLKVAEAIELFKRATDKDEHTVGLMTDLMIDLHCKIDLIHEEME
jgi:hypothetical protein